MSAAPEVTDRCGDVPESVGSAVLLVDPEPGAGGLVRALGLAVPGGVSAPVAELETALEAALPDGWSVVSWAPRRRRLPSALRHHVSRGLDELVVIPAHPHVAPRAAGRLLKPLQRCLTRSGANLNVAVRTAWHDDGGYVDAVARWIAQEVTARDLHPGEVRLAFQAPAPGGGRDAERYRTQARATMELVVERLGWPLERVDLDFVPRSGAESPGPSRPLQPRRLVCPLGCPEAAGSAGALQCPPLHRYPPYVAALRRLVLRGPRPLQPAGRRAPKPLLDVEHRLGPAGDPPASFVMIGASVAGGLTTAGPSAVRHSRPDAFARIKASHHEIRAFLDWVRERTSVQEALVWNTCQRVELYGWLPSRGTPGPSDALVRRLSRKLLGGPTEGLEINVLPAEEARRHLLRTACGLNSDLPGDRDVAAQLETALRRAENAGTVGPRATALVEEALALVAEVTTDTGWGQVATGYSAAALERVFEESGRPPSGLRYVLLGGSTTSRSVLRALVQDHGVPRHRLTMVYRSHHGQMKRIRSLLGHGKRLRVDVYSDRRVLAAMAEADVVVFGVDQPEPVLALSTLAELRDLDTWPLTAVDFNSFGSLGGADEEPLPEGLELWTAKDLDRAVAAHVAIITSRSGFRESAAQVEERIRVRLSSGRDAGARLDIEDPSHPVEV